VSLRRLDEAPITFYREPAASQSVSTATTEHGHEEDGTAQTATEKRTMRRAFWRYSLGIDYCSPASVGALVITLIIGGIAFAGLTIFIFSYAMPLLRTPFDFIALVAFTVVFGISGLAMVIGGLRLISTWRQIRHSLITTIEGTVNRWKAFSSSSRPYTIISFTMPDGTNHIFGVAPRFRYRAQQTHTRLAITYRTANEHVMDIQEID